MEIPMEDEKVVYTNYIDLVNPNFAEPKLNEVYGETLNMLKIDFWKDNYKALEQLRIFNKFYFSFLCTKLNEIDPYVKVCLDSLRSGILKMALLFIQEVAGLECKDSEIASRSECLKGYLPGLLQILFIKILDPKRFIVKEAETCLKSIATKSCSAEVVNTFCEQCFVGIGKGTSHSDNVMNYLEIAIVKNANTELWEATKTSLMPIMAEAVNTGRNQMHKKVTSILSSLKNVCGKEPIAAAIMGLGAPKTTEQKLKELLDGKGATKKKPDGGFKAFLQSKKAEKV